MEEGRQRRGPQSSFSTGHGRGGGGVSNSWCLQFSLSWWTQSNHPLARQGWGIRYRCPIHYTPGWLCPAFLVQFLFIVLKFSIPTLSQQILKLQLFLDEDGDEEEKYLPELCKHFEQTHTQGE